MRSLSEPGGRSSSCGTPGAYEASQGLSAGDFVTRRAYAGPRAAGGYAGADGGRRAMQTVRMVLLAGEFTERPAGRRRVTFGAAAGRLLALAALAAGLLGWM